MRRLFLLSLALPAALWMGCGEDNGADSAPEPTEQEQLTARCEAVCDRLADCPQFSEDNAALFAERCADGCEGAQLETILGVEETLCETAVNALVPLLAPEIFDRPMEDCTDGEDNDDDGDIDCDDGDCADNDLCSVEPEPQPEDCTDELDNDLDGDVDCEDSDCVDEAPCLPPTEDNCDDEIDNDEDGDTDCEDLDCRNEIVCQPPPPEVCNDEIDNDEDGDTDCDDEDCIDTVNCPPSVVPPPEGTSITVTRTLFPEGLRWTRFSSPNCMPTPFSDVYTTITLHNPEDRPHRVDIKLTPVNDDAQLVLSSAPFDRNSNDGCLAVANESQPTARQLTDVVIEPGQSYVVVAMKPQSADIREMTFEITTHPMPLRCLGGGTCGELGCAQDVGCEDRHCADAISITEPGQYGGSIDAFRQIFTSADPVCANSMATAIPVEQVFHLRTDTPTTACITSNALVPQPLYIREDNCRDPLEELACFEDADLVHELSMEADKNYFIIVEGGAYEGFGPQFTVAFEPCPE